MNPHLRMFLQIFCVMGLIGFGIGTILAASSAPVHSTMAIAFGAVTAVMAVGIFLVRRRAEL